MANLIYFAWFLENGCNLAIRDDLGLFAVIYRDSKGEPCLECADRKNCQTFMKLVDESEKSNQLTSRKVYQTNAEIAARLEISPRQVAKMRKAGKL